jgi:predicted DNA-binding transcriptional regulator
MIAEIARELSMPREQVESAILDLSRDGLVAPTVLWVVVKAQPDVPSPA